MKILITTDLYEPKINGVVTSILNLQSELQNRGNEVKILTVSDFFYSYKKDNVYYMKSVAIGVYPDVRMPVVYYNKYMKELIEWKPDVIHSQCEFFSFNFAKHIASKTHAPIIHTYHTLYEQYAEYVIKVTKLSNKVIAVMSKERLKNVDTIIAPTNKVKNALLEYGVENKIVVIPTGIEMKDTNRDTSGLKDKICDKYKINKNDKILLSLGRLGYEKNVKELIYNFAQVLKENINMTFIIVGDGPAKNDLMEYAKSIEIDDKVVFTGMVGHEETADFYSIADVFMCASTSETQGLTYIEAVSNGALMLCRRDKCIENVVIQGFNGYQYESLDEFKEYLNKILNDKEFKQSALACNKNVMKEFGKEKFANDVEQEYYNCCGTMKKSERKEISRNENPYLCKTFKAY